jgi:hypothetical protein
MDKKIEDAIFKTIDNINDELSLYIKKNDDSFINGGNSPLDSLGVFTFIIELEKNLENILETELSLMNDDFMSDDNNPFENVGKIKSHLKKIIIEN